MDMRHNRIPEAVKSVHLIAVCGSGMGALAGALAEMGYAVTGSDTGVYPPMSDFLAERGIRAVEGFRPENVAHRPDLVVIGNAISNGNPEAEAVREMELPFCSMSQAANHFIVGNRRVILPVGTHGKTTTASLAAWILEAAERSPSFFIGGIVRDFGTNCRVGGGTEAVVEGDEYDTAFFDKGPKFLHFTPHVAMLTSVEFDHADIYRDMDHVRSAFDRLLAGMGPDQNLLAWDGDPVVRELVRNRACRVALYGTSSESEWRMVDAGVEPPWSIFTVLRKGEIFGRFRTRLPGEHNRLNALAAIAAGAAVGVSPEAAARALETFQGPRRRQEIRGVANGIAVIDDFAHHPTAVRETIRAVRPFYPNGRLIAVFEPRTNTSMRTVFQEVYPLAFDGADIVCIRTPSRLDKVPEAERFSSEKLVADIRARDIEAHHFPETEGIVEFLAEVARPGDGVLVMSNGGFDNIHERLLERLGKFSLKNSPSAFSFSTPDG
ncbi:MAG: UDP-N-acetylmuramate--L-alanine ligase [Desulfococcaceae bacterium]